MNDDILFPTDGSDQAETVFEHVLDLAGLAGATVHVLNVADTARTSVARVEDGYVDVLEEEGERIVEAAADRASERGVPTITAVLQGRPHEVILGYAEEYDVGLVAMPTRSRGGLERLLLGSVTERVVRGSEAPVLTVRPEAAVRSPYRRVLVPTDGSACAEEAVAAGVRFATAHDAALEFLSVVDVTSLGVDLHSELETDRLEERARRIVGEAAEYARDNDVADVSTEIQYAASVSEAIVAYAEAEDADLVVVGTHGRTGLDRYLLGSVAEQLIRTAPVPVVTVQDAGSGSG